MMWALQTVVGYFFFLVLCVCCVLVEYMTSLGCFYYVGLVQVNPEEGPREADQDPKDMFFHSLRFVEP